VPPVVVSGEDSADEYLLTTGIQAGLGKQLTPVPLSTLKT
jgi:hypothetical protein